MPEDGVPGRTRDRRSGQLAEELALVVVLISQSIPFELLDKVFQGDIRVNSQGGCLTTTDRTVVLLV